MQILSVQNLKQKCIKSWILKKYKQSVPVSEHSVTYHDSAQFMAVAYKHCLI